MGVVARIGRKRSVCVLTGLAYSVLFGAMAHAADVDTSDEALLKRLDALQAELKVLKEQKGNSTVLPAPAGQKAASGVPVLSATDGVEIYGRIDLVAESNSDGVTTRPVLQNISSRIGFRGQRQLVGDLSGIFQIETGVAPDDNANSGTFASRNSYVGIKSASLGSLIAGRHDMPYKKLEGTASLLWGSAEAMEIIIHGRGTGRTAESPGTSWVHGHTRQPNVIQYWSPKFANIEAKLAYSPDETNGATGTVRTPVYGASIEYDDGLWNFGIASDTKEKWIVPVANGKRTNMTGIKATAGLKLGAWQGGLAYSNLDNHAGKSTDNWMIAGSYRFGQFELKANYGISSETASGRNDGLSMFGIELDYRWDKRTAVYVYYTNIDNDLNAKGRFEAGDNKYSPPLGGKTPHAIGLAVRYDF